MKDMRRNMFYQDVQKIVDLCYKNILLMIFRLWMAICESTFVTKST